MSELFQNMNRFSNQRSDITGHLVGEVWVAVMDVATDLSDLNLDRYIRGFKDRSPYTTLAPVRHPTMEMETGVAEVRFDLGVMVRQRDFLDLECWPLTPEIIGLFCGAGHPLFYAEPTAITLEDVETFERYYRDYIRLDDGKRRKELDFHTA